MGNGNFKLIALKDDIVPHITKGKVYEFLNGKTTWDNGYVSGHYDTAEEFINRNVDLVFGIVNDPIDCHLMSKKLSDYSTREIAEELLRRYPEEK